MRINQPVTTNEIVLTEQHMIVSKTDLKGQITYVNRDFLEISGFSNEELIGQPHNIVRHPDMPPEAFADMWVQLKAERPWAGLVKNRCKNGDFYWVEAHASPIWENGHIAGYMSVRRKPDSRAVHAAEAAYAALRNKTAKGVVVLHGKAESTALLPRLKRKLRDLPVALQFLIPTVSAVVLVMGISVFAIGQLLSTTLQQQNRLQLTQEIGLVKQLIDSTLDAVAKEANRLLDVYASRYPGTFSIDTATGDIPVLKHNGQVVNGHHDEEDAFARITNGPTATVLVRRGDEFVRVSTSQKNDKGERVVGTVLDKDSPATAKLLAGETYIGRTSSQGKDRVSALKPIKGSNGQVIGAFGIGYFITQEMSELRTRVKSIKIGDSGYVFVLDAQPGKKRGELLMHPSMEGQNIIASTDASGREFVREMLDSKEGSITYPWVNKERGDATMDKMAVYGTSEKWNLLVGGGTYLEELDMVSRSLNVTLIIIGLVVVAVLSLVMFQVSRHFITSRLVKVVESLKSLSTGNYRNEIDITAHDEIGQVMQGLESMQNRLGFEVAETQRIAEASKRIQDAVEIVTVPVTVSDSNNALIFMNKAAHTLLKDMEPAIAARHPGFSADQLTGKSLGVYFEDEETRAAYCAELNGSRVLDTRLSGHDLHLTISPVLDISGRDIGRVTQWVDRTAELATEQELSNLIEAASRGDFSTHVDEHGKNGFFLQLAQGMNRLIDTTSRSLNDVAKALQTLARGDLTQLIEADYDGVFGQLKDDTNQTVLTLQDVVARIKVAADAINTASREIAMGNQDLSSRTEEQASSLEETASSMEQLNSTIRQNADNSRSARELAYTSNEAANRGGEMVKKVVAAMSDIQDGSHKMSDIISVIDGIAFQTNILSLNASVEAARAGEQGRGFAVVANEVRNLAQRSAGAAREIKQLISSSITRVEEGVVLVEETGNVINEVLESFHQVTRLVDDISTASQEQSSGVDQVTLAISQMDEVTQQNAALVEEAAAAAESLEEQAQALVQSVATFKVPQQGHSFQPAKPAPLSGADLPPASTVSTSPAYGAIPKGFDGDEWETF